MDRNQKKTQLENTIDSVTLAIEEQLGEYREVGKKVMVIGGVLVLGYAFSRLFTDGDENEKGIITNPNVGRIDKEKPSRISSAIGGIATSLILTVLKQKLTDYLAQHNDK